ncbi:translation initiation factor IF-2 [Chitinivibrio alkaliphilus]|uniref:Translation initiation factor IF-2 n=1 Tax=Chitinivibrio alkaliphilus ACht1 TaxID=1313304 RepID=U7DAI8_9BACT|nr:translation initiation factor IF-2 [Chitinivibrio alkaliphilus]ERP32147.1 translation initiation factor IF-2 [Chitinivibrio alkaliphilus ACht1]
MSKIRVSSLAKELKISSDALVQILRSIGVPAKSHSSTVDEDIKKQVVEKIDSERAAIKKKYAKSKERLKSRRRSRRAPEKKKEEATPQKTEEQKPLQEKKDGSQGRQTGAGRPPRRPAGVTTNKPKRPATEPMGKSAGGPPRKKDDIPLPPPGGDIPAKEDTRKKNKKKNKKKKFEEEKPKNFSEKDLQLNIKKTMAKIGSGSTKKKYKKQRRDADEISENDTILHVSEFISISEFANMIDVNPSQVIAKCLELGLFVTINQRIDFETIQLLAEEWDYTAVLMDEFADITEDEIQEESYPEEPRSPVVTVMGHVDHGKTSLLDYIRKTNVTSGEHGGITQHIAAYEVSTPRGNVTFLDTPGHEAFAAMRARGSQITDVVVIIVAADSAVMPQTKEAIDHARAADVPIVIAINKTDLPTANIDKIKGELAAYDVLVEDYGGQISCVEISAKTGKGVDDLLELLALESDLLELTAPKQGFAKGVVIESELDPGRGAIATVLVQKGTLRKGDPFVTGNHSGRVRELLDDHGKKVKTAGPSQPVIILGLSGTPQAGDSFRVTENDKDAREIAQKRRLAEKEREMRYRNTVSLDNFYDTIKAGEMQTLNIIVKGDVDGSVQALSASLEELSTEEVKVKVIHNGVGGVTEADIMLAQASQGIIVGFHISPNPKIKEHAKQAGVEIRTYPVIYEAIDDVKKAMIGMLAPRIEEKPLGVAEIRDIFKVSKIGQIAGCYVIEGKITRDAKARLVRDDLVVTETKIGSLQRGKDKAKEVSAGFECGIILKNVTQYKTGDRIEAYTQVEIERTSLEE